jgi:hypothetical protein
MAMQQFVIPLGAGEAIDPDRVGPKAANLAALARDAGRVAPVYSAHKCVLKEGRKPCVRRRASCHVLQFCSHPSDAQSHASDGSRRD